MDFGPLLVFNPFNNRVLLKWVAHASLPYGVIFSTCSIHMKLLMRVLYSDQALYGLLSCTCMFQSRREVTRLYNYLFPLFLILLRISISKQRGVHFS